MSNTQHSPDRTVQHLDPRNLLVDANIRTSLQISPDFVATIRDLGVLVPVVAVRTAEGGIRVRLGNRRTIAAIDAGQDTVPVIVIGDEATDTAAGIERLITQYIENTQRAALTRGEEAGVVAALFDLGVSAAQIAKRTRIPKATVTAAKKVAASELARSAADRYQFMTLEQLAALADYEHDTEALTALIGASQVSQGQFDHVLARIREGEAERQILAQAQERYTANGLTILDQAPDWHQQLSYLQTADGEDLTEDNHRGCPGHAAFLEIEWTRPAMASEPAPDDQDAYTPTAIAVFCCTDPQAHEHRSRFQLPGSRPPAAVDAEQAKAERRKVIENNKAWRAAESVRRAWLTEFLTRKTPPKGGLRYVITELAAAHWRLTSRLGDHQMACQLLGLDGKAALANAADRASEARAQVLALAMIIGAFEDHMTTDTWRNPTPQDHNYLSTIMGWGYDPADIERAVLGDSEG